MLAAQRFTSFGRFSRRHAALILRFAPFAIGKVKHAAGQQAARFLQVLDLLVRFGETVADIRDFPILCGECLCTFIDLAGKLAHFGIRRREIFTGLFDLTIKRFYERAGGFQGIRQLVNLAGCALETSFPLRSVRRCGIIRAR